ncbi:MAG: hypothetical protein AAGA85_03785 [Bacteroidota bacterium]
MRNSPKLNHRWAHLHSKWYEALEHHYDVLCAFLSFTFNSFSAEIAPGTQRNKAFTSLQNLVTQSRPVAVGREEAFLSAQAYQVKD